jgi:hypothetical protein
VLLLDRPERSRAASPRRVRAGRAGERGPPRRCRQSAARRNAARHERSILKGRKWSSGARLRQPQVGRSKSPALPPAIRGPGRPRHNATDSLPRVAIPRARGLRRSSAGPSSRHARTSLRRRSSSSAPWIAQNDRSLRRVPDPLRHPEGDVDGLVRAELLARAVGDGVPRPVRLPRRSRGARPRSETRMSAASPIGIAISAQSRSRGEAASGTRRRRGGARGVASALAPRPPSFIETMKLPDEPLGGAARGAGAPAQGGARRDRGAPAVAGGARQCRTAPALRP